MIVNAKFAVLVWLHGIAAVTCCRHAATHSKVSIEDERKIHHPVDQYDHYAGRMNLGLVESSRVRSGRTLVKNTFNTTFFTSNIGLCATFDPSSDMLVESSRIAQKWKRIPNSRQPATIDVSTYFHIVTADVNYFTEDLSKLNETVGNITDDDVTNQLQVLNNLFRPYGFAFTLKGTTRNDNTDWYYFDDDGMKSTLQVGDASTLNVYFTAAFGGGGYATFPWDYEQSPKLDGVVVNSYSIPGSPNSYRNEGKVLVHEVGHWLGLLHTFQFQRTSPVNEHYVNENSLFYIIRHCLLNNDQVDDTPRQKSPTYGCPTSRDSCLFYRGSDPIHNYMDYSEDRCVSEFSNGQVDRMKAMWNEYRAV